MGNTLRNKVIQFHEKIVFDFLKKIRNYLVANPIKKEEAFTLKHSISIRMQKTKEEVGGGMMERKYAEGPSIGTWKGN